MEYDVFDYYLTTITAAADVYCLSTGCNEWDMLDIHNIIGDVPTDIYEWKKYPIRNKDK